MAYNTIAVISEGSVQKEALASGSITPGHLLEQTTAAADTVKVHATAGGHAQSAFAVEDDLQGNTIDDAYASGKRVLYKVFRPGDEVYALIANGENISKDDMLMSAGDGTLKETTGDSSGTIVEPHIVGYAREACDMSDSSGADPSGRCLVEIC